MSQAAIEKLQRSTDSRPTRSRPITLITLPSDARVLAAGSLNVFVAHGGNGLLDQVRASMNDPAAMRAVQAQLDRAVLASGERTIEAAVDIAVAQPIHGQIRLGERLLHGHVVLPPDIPLAVFTFAYNGASLADAGLTWAESYADDSAGLDVLAIAREPALTPAARSAVDALDMRARAAGVMALTGLDAKGEDACEDHATGTLLVTAALLTTAVAVRLVTVTTTTLLATNQAPVSLGLSDDEIARLGNEATARHIVEAHRASMRDQRGKA